MRKITALGCALMLGACNAQPGPQTLDLKYKISEDSIETKNERTYESLGDKTFTRVQKYKIVAEGESAKLPHFLVASMKLKVGKKTIQSIDATIISIKDGVEIFECEHNYDVKLSVAEEEIESPTCEIKPIGVIPIQPLPEA